MDTDKLIQALSATVAPVRVLRSPWTRGVFWLAIAMPYIALVIYVMSPRADLTSKIVEVRFLVEQLAALATGLTAGVAAFAATIPGYPRQVLIAPLLPLALWIGSLGQGCVNSWITYGSEGLSLTPDWFCLPAIVLVGAIPAVAMVIMLRRGAPLMPCMTTALGGLAAAGLGNFGLRFFHPQDASVMVLVWQVGSVFLLSVLAACVGRYLLNWKAVIAGCGVGLGLQRN